MRPTLRPIVLAFMATLAVSASANVRAQDTVTLSAAAHHIAFGASLTGDAATPIADITIAVDGGDPIARTNGNGRARFDVVRGGSATVTVGGGRFEASTETLDLAPGTLHTVALVEVGACPPGEACLLSADAVVELAVEPFERTGDVVVELLMRDGTTLETPVPMPIVAPHTFSATMGQHTITVDLRLERNVFSSMWYARAVADPGGLLVDDVVAHIDPWSMPGCAELCTSNHPAIRQIRFARSNIGDPTALCEPRICP